MHGLSRLGNGRSISVSTTPSPPSSPRFRHSRGKSGSGGAFSVVLGGSSSGGSGRGAKQSVGERVVYMFISAVFKRKGVLLLAPLLYITGMLLYMGSFGFEVVNLKHGVVRKRAPPGSMYRSPQVFERLWPFMEAESNGSYNTVLLSLSFSYVLNEHLWLFVEWVDYEFGNCFICQWICFGTLYLLF